MICGFPGGSDGKESAYNVGDPGFNSWVIKIPWRREWLPTPVFWPEEFHEFQAPLSLAGYSHGSLWGCEESDMTECLTLSIPDLGFEKYDYLICICFPDTQVQI